MNDRRRLAGAEDGLQGVVVLPVQNLVRGAPCRSSRAYAPIAIGGDAGIADGQVDEFEIRQGFEETAKDEEQTGRARDCA
jgi:hypothetical protein